jgi:hypothetical protein
MAVIRDKQGKVIWNRVELPRDLESLSTGTHVLSSSQAIDWMQRVPTITAVLFEKHHAATVAAATVPSTSLLSTGCISATLIVERTEPNGPPARRVRYYRYLLGTVADGRVYQAGPDKVLDDLPFDHHESKRPHSLEALLAWSTSTGW